MQRASPRSRRSPAAPPRSWFLRVSGIAQAVEAIAATLFTVEAAEALILMAGAASWAALIDGVVHCYHLM